MTSTTVTPSADQSLLQLSSTKNDFVTGSPNSPSQTETQQAKAKFLEWDPLDLIEGYKLMCPPPIVTDSMLAGAKVGSWPYSEVSSANRPSLIKRRAAENPPVRTNSAANSKWFTLPGEIRNKIYDFLTDEAEFDILWLSRHGRSLTSNRLKNPRYKRSYEKKLYALHVDTHYEQTSTGAETLSRRKTYYWKHRIHWHFDDLAFEIWGYCSWLLTCRQMHDEGGQYLYQKATFTFRSHILLRDFLSKITPQLLPFIRSILVKHQTGGEPIMRSSIPFRDRINARWAETCQILTTLPGLQYVEILLRVNDSPFYALPKEGWTEPLRKLADLNLRGFKLTLLHSTLHSDTEDDLKIVCEILRKIILKDNYKELKPAPRQRKVLRITGI